METPRTNAVLAEILGEDGELCDGNAPMKIVRLCKTLERELDAEIAKNDGWKIICDDLDKKLNDANERIAELESQRENWRMSSVCREKDAQIAALRAAAERMAKTIHDYIGTGNESLAAWKEAAE